ncbi:bifunctional 5,10-methylenetetrahydrofolate dehydrogenase/5,10-methenyltetrahydrofolate cyclohydrolase [Fonticella tunisiensis]|uniref:Bifunctional protein FolD n=1 Tax=Fonticella tunisiensis TaxID=1096341 RepID=A0A4R7KRD8_9CLOT|nr:bifunctional 5,10-methylenetetrahydrofolate dehydrogenase/5,10-methenyltetrahydrofolate cyclohydrolase [Fonticella tunisiensis]TDT61941.1 methenyltetrahydrofolate cyclohydrolase /5,10-methylenetetrahydrofolate dehydrogenase (NADP+) [Fonticella tunisiensis]
MKGKILDGREVSKRIKESLKERIEKMKEERGITPGLAVIITGGNPSAISYVRSLEKVCRQTCVNSFVYELPAETSEEDLIKLINELNIRDDVNGILVQLPLPKHINPEEVAKAIKPSKDVDGFNPINAGKLFRGEKCLVPCTPKGVMRLISEYGIELKGKKAAVVGRSNIVGKPVSQLLLNKDATVVICHSKTKELDEELISCDIIVSAAGKPGFIKSNMVKEGAVVIDVGTTMVEGKLMGDVDFEEVIEKASFITPVPGGVGAMTTAMLIENVLEAMETYD